MAAAVGAFGGVDCAVNCAAVTHQGARVPTAEVDIERCFAAVESGQHDLVFATRASPESEIPVPQP